MTTNKLKPLSLRTDEAAALAKDGRVTVVRAVGHWIYDGDESGCGYEPYDCPFGEVGSKFWVREPWAANAFLNQRRPSELQGETIYYRATYYNDSHFMWRSPAQMPCWASRFTIETVAVECRNVAGVWEWRGDLRRVEA